MNKKQFIVAVSLVVALAIGAFVVFIAFSNKAPQENNVISTIVLSTDQLTEVEILSSTFLQEGANFGINMDTLSTETVSQRMQDITNDNGGTSWLKRTEVSSRLVSEYMDLSGGFVYAADRIANADYTDGNTVSNFKSLAMDVKSDGKANYVYTSRDEPILLATVNFGGTSALTHFSQSDSINEGEHSEEDHDAESTPWDIKQQTVQLKGAITLSQDEDGGAWRVRDLKFEEGEFAFPFWKPEKFTTSYPGIELGGTVVRSIEFPNHNQKEDLDVQR